MKAYKPLLKEGLIFHITDQKSYIKYLILELKDTTASLTRNYKIGDDDSKLDYDTIGESEIDDIASSIASYGHPEVLKYVMKRDTVDKKTAIENVKDDLLDILYKLRMGKIK
jgi:hypothetical protein